MVQKWIPKVTILYSHRDITGMIYLFRGLLKHDEISNEFDNYPVKIRYITHHKQGISRKFELNNIFSDSKDLMKEFTKSPEEKYIITLCHVCVKT